MPDRRDLEPDDPDLKEDMGIFKRDVVEVSLSVTPLKKTTSRGDILCLGYIDDTEIEVIFPGRRRAATEPLFAQLDRLVRKSNHAAHHEKKPAPPITSIRLPLRAEGTWRSRLYQEKDEVVDQKYQFLVARWMIRDAAGVERIYGRPVSRPHPS